MFPVQVHSNYSLLEGAIPIEILLKKALEFNYQTLSLTDKNGMYGLIPFYKKARELNLKPILGVMLTDPDDDSKYALFLAKNNLGYSDICRIITSRKLNDDFKLENVLKDYHENLIIITPSPDLLKITNSGNKFYGELLFVEKNKIKNKNLIQYARENNIKLVPSIPVYFLEKEDYILHKLLRAIDLNTTIDNLKNGETVDQSNYFRNKKELSEVFSSEHEWLINFKEIERLCNVDLEIGKFHYPNYPNPIADSFTQFYKIVYEGFTKKYPNPSQNEKDRIQYEIDVISSLNFVDYFLIVWDIVQEAKRRGMLYIGRGSAANSMVAYCMDITQIEPIRNNLFFERFLNKARSSPPDIDLDFSWKERDEIIKYVFEKYGYDKVAMISTHVTFKARSAFRETAKAFGISEREISGLSKKIPWTSASNLPNISKLFPESRSLKFDEEPWKTIVNLASRIAHFPRHLSIHPGGVVITPKRVTDYCALEYAKNKGLGIIVTQPDMYSIEDLGLIKLDLLSQRSLGVLRDSLKMINSEN